MSHFLVAYDVTKSKRRVQVAKLVYGYALGGQKSALEVPADQTDIQKIVSELKEKIDFETDKVNIVKVEKNAILLGTASQIEYENGMVLL